MSECTNCTDSPVSEVSVLEVGERLVEEVVQVEAHSIACPAALGSGREHWRQHVLHLRNSNNMLRGVDLSNVLHRVEYQ